MTDKYCYPGTHVLINTLNIRDPEVLREAELNFWINAAARLPSRLPNALKFDLPLWQLIHKETFGKIYPWAGEIRDVMISKGNAVHAAPRIISPYSNQILSQLKNENHLKGLKQEDFLKRGSYYFEELNAIHPFREGNTRTLKLFFSLIAHHAGYTIDWNKINAHQYQQAETLSFSTAKLDRPAFYEPLKGATKALEPANVKTLRFKL